MGGAAIRVFLLDDHEIVRRGVRGLLESEADMVVVGEAGRATGAAAQILALSPDVAVLDARLPDGSGIEVCREVRSADPGIKALVLTSHDDDEAMYAAILAGAAGYVLKEIEGSSLVSGIRLVASGHSLIDAAAAQRLLHRTASALTPSPGRGAALTEREQEVLTAIGDGLTNRQIAERLHMAEKTVKNHVTRVLAKLGVEHRTQAALHASRLRTGPR